ncbi:MAG: type II toxin-antitoxin system HicA family toxin [Candidatus Omnitrophota bacterium]|nr:type II toxin-antitoxin system HicA family toxin [Candidatus Omnitrophota bacterium]
MSNIVISQKKFIKILKTYNFYPKRQVGSHQQWEGIVDDIRRLVSVDLHYHTYSHDLLASMIRQSGLPKKIFRSQ